jgi:hypothetical protein
MEPEYGTDQNAQAFPARGDRRAEAAFLAGFRLAQKTEGKSLLQYAQQYGVPESTVRHWVSRAQASGAPKGFVELVESPEGLLLLHRIVLAAMFVIVELCGGGVRQVCKFLELSGLWRVVATGYGTQQQEVKAMEQAIVQYGKNNRKALGDTMKPRDITVTRDETFHEQPCLVAIEPVSNFILLEEHAADRRAETWLTAMERGLSDLPVRVIQGTSDEGSSLRSLDRQTGAHSSPDLFHPQQDISRATSLALQRQVEASEQAVVEAALYVESLIDESEAYDAQHSGPGRPRDYQGRIEEAYRVYEKAEAAATEASGRRQRVREAARGISRCYHPFDLETGAVRDAAKVESEIHAHFAQIDAVAEEAGLSSRCRALLDKARRVLPQMVATIAFVHTLIRDKVSALDLAPVVDDAVCRLLIPLYYLEECVRKAPTAEARAAIRSTIASLRERVEGVGSPLAALPAYERDVIARVARECAQLFQRSSSNVEGRNGVLSLLHHSLHKLTQRKLNALTVIHNYFIRRPDGTTAAERFFGQAHDDLFEHLLAVMPPPRRPAALRRVVH